MTEPIVRLDVPQRQSLLAIVFLAFRTVRQIGIVQLVVGAGFVLSRSPSLLWVILGVVVIGAIFLAISALSWWRYTFVVRDGELRVDKGILSRDTLTVPLDRVQSVSIEQKALHRLVQLVQVSLDTAGTSTAEFTFDAVDRSVAVELQRMAADFKASAAPVAPAAEHGLIEGEPPPPTIAFEERELLRHSPQRLLRIAITKVPFSGLAVLAPLFVFGEELLDFFPFDLPDVDLDVGLWLAWFIPAAIVAVAIFGAILNLISTFLSDWNLRITQTESGLRRDAGLLSTTSVASSVPRVQSVEVRQGIVQRVVGLHDVTLHNVGDGDFSVPGCTADQVELIKDVGLDDGAGVDTLNRQVSALQVYKDTRNAAVLFALLAFGLSFLIGWWVVLFVIPIVWTYFSTRRSTRLRRWGIDADSIADRRQFIGWSEHEALLRKANAVSVSQSMFERRRGLATVHVSLAGGILSGGSLSIGMVPVEEAMAVRDHVLFVVETDRRVFM